MFDKYTLVPTLDFYQRFGIVNRLPSFPKDSNISPGQIQPVITHQECLTLIWVMKWGMIPHWAKERGVGGKMFNVNADSLVNKIGFRQSFKTHRCLIPASSFNGYKNDSLFSFAGVYDIWLEPVSGHEVYSYAIVTDSKYSPIVLQQYEEQIWLDPRTPTSRLESILRSAK